MAATSSTDPGLTRPGGLSYLEIPALDGRKSAHFYEHVLGWKPSERESGDFRFTDASGHLIGRWSTDHAIALEPGLLPYFYVDRIEDAVERVSAHGGAVVKGPYPEGNLRVAVVRDPAGNLIGLWQITSTDQTDG